MTITTTIPKEAATKNMLRTILNNKEYSYMTKFEFRMLVALRSQIGNALSISVVFNPF